MNDMSKIKTTDTDNNTLKDCCDGFSERFQRCDERSTVMS
jgi:hypothetical protein